MLAVVEEARARQQALVEETPEVLEALGGLSCREREVLALLAEGQTDLEIAEALAGATHFGSASHLGPVPAAVL